MVALCLAFAVASPARARVKHEGTWPAADKNVSLDLKGVPRADAVKKLADAAGWGLIIRAPKGDLVDVHVTNQPAQKVLEFLLSDADYVAKFDGSLLSIEMTSPTPSPTPAASSIVITLPGLHASAAPPVPPVPAAPPVPGHADSHDDAAEHAADIAQRAADEAERARDEAADAKEKIDEAKDKAKRGEDRTVAGGNLRIEKDEVAHDITVFGGNVDIFGTVTGDVSVMGGNVHVRESAHIHGDASALGGSLVLDDGSAIDGDVSVMGGALKRSSKCKIGGTVVTKGGNDSDGGNHAMRHTRVREWLSDLGGAITRAAMLFVFGAVLLALASKRMEMMRVEVASRPMRSFAVGIVGSLAALAVFVALCVTVVGIPVAIIGLLLGVFGAYAGVCAALTVGGEAVLRHKTKNPYVHLAAGCGMFLVIGAIPYVGGFVTAAVAFIGIGILVATRGAGFVAKKKVDEGPYRTVVEG